MAEKSYIDDYLDEIKKGIKKNPPTDGFAKYRKFLPAPNKNVDPGFTNNPIINELSKPSKKKLVPSK